MRIIDVVADDADGREVLLVEVKGTRVADSLVGSYAELFRSARTDARFGMIADPELIRVIDLDQWDGEHFALVLGTAEILERYDADFASKRVFEPYLGTLIGSWLRDVMYRWDSPSPPGLKELTGLGLAQAIAGVETRREVKFTADPVR